VTGGGHPIGRCAALSPVDGAQDGLEAPGIDVGEMLQQSFELPGHLVTGRVGLGLTRQDVEVSRQRSS
jgi:hypothetical protein